MAVTVVATYDVREDDRRSRLAALLQVHGDRIQKSVFILNLEPDDLEAVVERARQIIDTSCDSFYILRQCRDCWDSVVCIGQAGVVEPSLCWIVG
jgi:CRISPR-associated protein Cas2